MVHLHPDVAWRRSKRGLVLASPACGSLLFEHPRSAALVDLLADDPDPSRLRAELGPPLPDDFVDVLLRLDVLTEGGTASADQRRPHGVEVTASGILLPGVGGPARWLARLVPGVSSRAGRVALGTVVVAGVAAMLAGRPDLPSVSAHPAIEALLMLFLTLLIAICHELAHAVALVHYGREPTRAGFGFYWGALCFYVDSTAALTLTRRQRVTQALVGLAVNVVALSVCAVAAHLCSSPLLAIVFWRVSVLGLVGVAVNLAPILEVDGHWALADLLDEPDLAPRARRSLALAMRGRRPEAPWLAAYGAASLVAGLVLIGTSVYVFWQTTGDLVQALLTGSATDLLIGLYYVVPLALGVGVSALGLLLETAWAPAPVATPSGRR